MTDSVRISPYLTLLTTGEVSGLACGRRPSAVVVARQEGAANVHVLFPKSHAKIVASAVEGLRGVQPKDGGRLWVAKDSPEVQTIVGRVEDAIAAAKAAKRAAPVAFPSLDGVSAFVEGCDVVVRMDADREALAEIKGGAWDADRFAAPALRARAVSSALTALSKVRADRAARAAEAVRVAAAAEAARVRAEARRIEGERHGIVLAERLRGVTGITVEGAGHVRLAFRYDAQLVAMVRALPDATYVPSSRTWVVRPSTDADVDRIVAAALHVAERVLALAEAETADRARREQEKLAADAEWHRANPYHVERRACAPAVGEIVRLGREEVVVVIRHGRPFRADEELSSLGGTIGAEGEWCCRVYHRSATAEEIAALEAREAADRARAQAAQAVRGVVARVIRDGEDVDLGHEPEGEVLLRNDRSALLGYATRIVLDGEGALWAVTYDGSDGALWGTYNLGYNTRGRRLRVTPDEVSALRAAIEVSHT